jgi:hypothetical protein
VIIYFWDVTPYSPIENTNISEEPTFSIFTSAYRENGVAGHWKVGSFLSDYTALPADHSGRAV